MKHIKWKKLIVTCAICLLPMVWGLILWNKLPDTMAIHFDIYGNPDNFASKGFVVFGLPVLMVALQVICCLINDINAHKHGAREKFERVTKWIIPCLTIVLQGITLGYGLGFDLDIRKAVSLIIGVMFIILGNYMPKLDRVKNYDTDTQKARKINRFIGCETVFMGLLFIISTFLPPVSSIICLGLLIPYAVTGIVYGVVTGRRQEF